MSALLLMGLLACNDDAPEAPSGQASFEDLGEAGLDTTEQVGRAPRRMNIDQLQSSLLQVTGGVGWEEREGNETVDLFDALSGTLGKPDYLGATSEDLEPGLLFQKFLDDAAKSACGGLAERERAGGDILLAAVGPTDTPSTAPQATRENLSQLLLRFHGRSVPTDSEQLDPWLTLLDGSIAVTGDPVGGWRNVCVALVTHPDFYTY